MEFVHDRLQNQYEKRKNTGYMCFLLFPQCLKRLLHQVWQKSGCVVKDSPIPIRRHLLVPLGNKLFENTEGKGEIAHNKQFLFSHSVFYQFRELFAIHIKLKIVVCRLFQFGPV